MDSNLNEKLNRFSAAVLSDAQKKRAEIEEENELIKKKKNDEAQNEFLKEAFEKIQSAVTDIRRENNEKVLMAEVNARRELFSEREKIIDNVFNEVKERLSEFTKTEEYGKWLVKRIEAAAEETGSGNKTVYVRSEDEQLLKCLINDISDKGGKIEIKKTDENIIGGVKVLNNERGIIADYTFDEILAGKKNDFLNKSGLSIE